MKTSKQLVLALSAALVFASCAKNDDKKAAPAPTPPPVQTNPDGTPDYSGAKACTDDFKADWNSLGSALNNTNRDGGIDNANKTCDDFFAKHNGVVCKIGEEGNEQFLESKTYRQSCQSLKGGPLPEEPGLPPGAPQGADELVLLELVPAKLTSRILNAEKIKTAISSKLVFVRGRMGTTASFSNELQEGASYCSVIDTDATNQEQLQANATLSTKQIQDEIYVVTSTRMMMIEWGAKFAVGCTKLSHQPFKLGEAREALRGVIEFSAAP